MCRYGARRLSAIKPQLDAHNVRLTAIGLERLGAEEFITKGFFTGDLYIDEKKKCYQDLGYKRFNLLSVFASLVSAISRRTISGARREGIEGNFQGDGLQNGGLLIVTKGGEKVLLNHKEEVPGDHVANEDILKVLNISDGPGSEGPRNPPTQQDCQDTCQV